MSINMYIATLAWLLLVLGYLNRTNKALHVPLMLSGIVLDIALVLYLQVTRDAVHKALSFTLTPLQQLHVASSTIALVLYFPVLYLGFQLIKGNFAPKIRQFHIRIATTALVFRCIGFALMFSMWKD